MKRSLGIIFIAFIFICFSEAQTKTIYEQISSVNSNWQNIGIFSSELSDSKEIKSERELIQTHLDYVIRYLLSQDRNLNSGQLENRKACIDELVRYRKNGIFPINNHHLIRQPYFIDEFGNYCAVGYLLRQTGYSSVAKKINREMNFANVKDIPVAYLNDWAQTYGFTIDELALIQPTYAPYILCRNDTFYIGKNTSTVCSMRRNDLTYNGLCGGLTNNPTINIISPPSQGSATIVNQVNDTILNYTPMLNYTGIDSMKYEVLWGDFSCGYGRDTATIRFLIVNPPGSYITYIPGDGNYTGTINNQDPLYIARSFGETGNTVISNNGSCAVNYNLPWNATFSGFNAASCDVDGNGIVNNLDIDDLLNCISPIEPVIEASLNSRSYSLRLMPYDSLLKAGDRIDFNFIVADTNGHVVPVKALSLKVSQAINKANLISTNLRCTPILPDTNIIYPKFYSIPCIDPYGSNQASLNMGAFGLLDHLNLQNQSCGIIDSFNLSGLPLIRDSIFSTGLMYLVINSVAGLDTNNNIFAISGVNVIYNVSNLSAIAVEVPEDGIRVFPNPVSEHFVTIVISETPPAELMFTIFDVLGRKVKTKVLSEKTTRLQIADLPNGFYQVIISENEKKLFSDKLIVQQ